MIVCGINLCDFKRASWNFALPAALRLKGDITFALAIETEDCASWGMVEEMLAQSGRSYVTDFWCRQSSWFARSPRDQDGTRFDPINMGYNLIRSYALVSGATHLLNIDADVVVEPDGLQRLLALNRLLCGGYVPGRGAHSHVHYVFGERWRKGNIINVAHGTCGYMLVARRAFSAVAFRGGMNQDDLNGGFQGPDPLFANDILHIFGVDGEWWVDTSIHSQHLDDPDHPLTLANAANTYPHPPGI